MWIVLLVFLFSGGAGAFAGIAVHHLIEKSLPISPWVILLGVVSSAVVGVVIAYSIGRISLGIVNKKWSLSCPVCEGAVLEEKHTLQCRMPEYQCQHCQRVYRDGQVIGH